MAAGPRVHRRPSRLAPGCPAAFVPGRAGVRPTSGESSPTSSESSPAAMSDGPGSADSNPMSTVDFPPGTAPSTEGMGERRQGTTGARRSTLGGRRGRGPGHAGPKRELRAMVHADKSTTQRRAGSSPRGLYPPNPIEAHQILWYVGQHRRCRCPTKEARSRNDVRPARDATMTRFDSTKLDASPISAVDLFCGAGGLTHGLLRAGIRVEAGIDVDTAVAHAYSTNNAGARFLAWDVGRKNCPSIAKLFANDKYRLLAGCAPCQPFSNLTNGIARHRSWDLLNNFGRFVEGIEPELVTMENVPELARRGREVFDRFLRALKGAQYYVDWKIVNCSNYGVPQSRKRLVLLASRLGPIAIPEGTCTSPAMRKTVRQVISGLPPLAAGATDPNDPLHTAAALSPVNQLRIRATPRDGGTWEHWPKELVLQCHRQGSGARYSSIYGRMWWDKPAPTMTTSCNGIGNGRFGHPEQDRALTLREAALLQTFPLSYDFWPRGTTPKIGAIARMIGNAVPPELAQALGEALLNHVRKHEGRSKGRSS